MKAQIRLYNLHLSKRRKYSTLSSGVDYSNMWRAGCKYGFLNSYISIKQKRLKKLDHSVQLQVLKGIQKVSRNPLSIQEGGYGKPLGNKTGTDLTNLLKIKFRDLGIRVVYKTIRIDNIMKIIVISARTDDQVYREAGKRRTKYEL